MTETLSIFWFRRDLRLYDNHGLHELLNISKSVLLLFIIDERIISKLKNDDPRLSFIFSQLKKMYAELDGKGLRIEFGDPVIIFDQLSKEYAIENVYFNSDYEPYARERDTSVYNLLKEKQIAFRGFKDQVFFHKDDIVKNDKTPYKIFTPYKKRWLEELAQNGIPTYDIHNLEAHLVSTKFPLHPFLLKYRSTEFSVLPKVSIDVLRHYDQTRDIPAIEGTSKLGVYLRFGVLSIRELIATARKENDTFLSELIWREFFMMIIYFFPENATQPFRKSFESFQWENSEADFERWKNGETGFPLVDAGMRELNSTGFMHNRVRMVCASFLTKHLLIHYEWGERYFAEKLMDFDLSANNGNWQWCAGCGVDAAPYFRIFNPFTQQKRFDPNFDYIKTWVPEYKQKSYTPMIDHAFARELALERYERLKLQS